MQTLGSVAAAAVATVLGYLGSAAACDGDQPGGSAREHKHDREKDEQRDQAQGWLARETGLLSSLCNRHLPELLAALGEGKHHYVVIPFLEGETRDQ